MKKALLIITVAILAAGCNFYHGEDGEDGSLNMRVAFYEIVDRDWIFDPGEGRDGLNRHYFYTVDKRMDPDLELYLNTHTFDDTIIIVEREIQVWDPATRQYVVVRVQVPNTMVIEEIDGNNIVPHTEILTYNYGVNPAQINFHFFDSRFEGVNPQYPPPSMMFRVVFMWP